jgi:hypothetical protein
MAVNPPQYVETNGQQSWPPPIVFEKVNFNGFVLQGERTLLQDLIDRQLNQPCGGAMRFHVPSRFLLLYFADFPKCYFEVMKNMGWSSQREAAIWMPLLRRDNRDPAIQRLCVYSPYVFVDNPVALTAGREVFGFFKESGSIGMPDDPGNAGAYTLETLGAVKYNSATKIGPVKLLRLDSDVGSGSHPWADLRDAVARVGHGLELSSVIAAPDGAAEDGDWDWDPLFSLTPSIVFLKQFRSIGAGQDACYQAIAEVVPKISAFHGVELEHLVHFHLNTVESHPLAGDLGLADQTVRLAFNARFDMRFPAGQVLWEAR